MTNPKKALICGISGQDGTYLSKLLLEKGYFVTGTSRDAQMSKFDNLRKLDLIDKVQVLSMSLTDFRSVIQVLSKVQPDEIYNFAGQSSVGLSFEQPVDTMESIAIGTLNLLESIRFLNLHSKLYNAGSGECFGDAGGEPVNEKTQFRPKSPYGVAKSAAHWEVVNYREAYGLFACNGILFNHESPLRPERFVTTKIVLAAERIYKDKKGTLKLGNLQIKRDWGWAPEYVEAMWLMLQQPQPDDFVISTGASYSLEEFVSTAFSHFGLNWKEFVDIDRELFRPTEIMEIRTDPTKAEKVLGWKAKNKMMDVVSLMLPLKY